MAPVPYEESFVVVLCVFGAKSGVPWGQMPASGALGVWRAKGIAGLCGHHG